MALLGSYGTGIYTAVSLRKVNDSYLGSCIKVRRSSDDTTQDIGFDSNGDLDTSSLLSFVGAGDGFVEVWYIQDSTGPDFQALSHTIQPRIVDNGSLVEIDGRPAIEFTEAQEMVAAGIGSFTSLSIFVVSKANTSATSGARIVDCELNSSNRFKIQQQGNTNSFLYTLASDGVISSSPAFTDHVLSTFIWDNSGLDVWKNKSYVGAGILGVSGTMNTGSETINIGSSGGANFFEGKIQEVLIFDANKTADRPFIDSDIYDYWFADILEANNLGTSNPSLDSPDIGQEHNINADEFSTSPSTADNPNIGQSHKINTQEISSTVSIESSDIGQSHSFSSSIIGLTGPTLDEPNIGQDHSISGSEIVFGNPSVDTPTINEITNLSANSLESIVILETSQFAQVNSLSTTDISSAVEVDNAVIGQVHELSVSDLDLSAVSVDSTSISQSNSLSVSDFVVSTPTVANADLAQTHVLLCGDLSSLVNVSDSDISQVHVLSILDISSTIFLGEPTAVLEVNLGSDNISSTVLVDLADINQSQRLISAGFDFDNPLLESPDIEQEHQLNSNELSSTVVLDEPTLEDVSDVDSLSSNSITAGVVLLDSPTLTGIVELIAEDIGYCPYDITAQLEVINRGVQRASKLIPHSEDISTDVCESLSDIADKLEQINNGLKEASKLIPYEQDL